MKVEMTTVPVPAQTYNPVHIKRANGRIPKGLYILKHSDDKVFLISDGMAPTKDDPSWIVMTINTDGNVFIYRGETWNADFIEAPAGTTITITA